MGTTSAGNGNIAQASIYLDTHFQVGEVDRRIFGGFLEHLGRAVYEGVYDPGNQHGLIDENGFRTDVLAALRSMGMPVIRYPGGNFVSCYDWKDGIGPRDQRPVRPDFAWSSLETNQFGTDEFMAWCKTLGAAPMLAVNLGTKGALDAIHLLEYCNLSTDTYWANQRRRNASAEPYGVKLWCLGNEMDGPWQAGHCPASVYGQRAREAGAMMKKLDRTIETVACGSSTIGMSTYLEYDREVLEIAWDYVDYISAHRYSNNDPQDSAWFLAEGVEIDRILQDYDGLLSFMRGRKKSQKRVYLSFDEWNVWYKNHQTKGQWQVAPHLLEEWYNHEDALVCAQYLNAFIRRADLVKVACLAQIVNVIAPVMTRPEGIAIQTIYYPIAAISAAVRAGARSLVQTIESPSYRAGPRGDVPAVDASTVFHPETGTLGMFFVNRDATRSIRTQIRIADRKPGRVIEVSEMVSADLKAGNTFEDPNRVRPTPGHATIEGDSVVVTIPPAGFVSVQVETTPR